MSTCLVLNFLGVGSGSGSLLVTLQWRRDAAVNLLFGWRIGKCIEWGKTDMPEVNYGRSACVNKIGEF
ncbi:hypothetical protein PR001_g27240 [Phytophthora rubi]|uniref:Uncharacterized protein n=1 Tax=Phytophthora rubi TaxID=129364 RepID=A0A6A3HMZ1_9STRA|nr:hypothetical protein PR001_g27240 [Phytophthora rubi]